MDVLHAHSLDLCREIIDVRVDWDFEVRLGVRGLVALLALDLLGETAGCGGDETEVGGRGVERAGAELGVSLESRVVRVVCNRVSSVTGHGRESKRDAPLSSATCIRTPFSSLPVK